MVYQEAVPDLKNENDFPSFASMYCVSEGKAKFDVASDSSWRKVQDNQVSIQAKQLKTTIRQNNLENFHTFYNVSV